MMSTNADLEKERQATNMNLTSTYPTTDEVLTKLYEFEEFDEVVPSEDNKWRLIGYARVKPEFADTLDSVGFTLILEDDKGNKKLYGVVNQQTVEVTSELIKQLVEG